MVVLELGTVAGPVQVLHRNRSRRCRVNFGDGLVGHSVGTELGILQGDFGFEEVGGLVLVSSTFLEWRFYVRHEET